MWAGLLTEPLARLGAKVAGIDAVDDLIQLAKVRAAGDEEIGGRVEYGTGTVDDWDGGSRQFDAVVASEVIEHVPDRQSFLVNSLRHLKPGGSIFLTTINRTALSRVLAIYVAEQVLKVVPAGIHDWEKFTTPQELRFLLEKEGCVIRFVHGLVYEPLFNRWHWSPYTPINYAIHTIKKE